LQQAIAREEKARETIEKKVEKKAKRTVAREELAREKAARQAEKKAKKAQKAREKELRKIEIKKKTYRAHASQKIELLKGQSW
jgi:hypothetical protein